MHTAEIRRTMMGALAAAAIGIAAPRLAPAQTTGGAAGTAQPGAVETDDVDDDDTDFGWIGLLGLAGLLGLRRRAPHHDTTHTDPRR